MWAGGSVVELTAGRYLLPDAFRDGERIQDGTGPLAVGRLRPR